MLSWESKGEKDLMIDAEVKQLSVSSEAVRRVSCMKWKKLPGTIHIQKKDTHNRLVFGILKYWPETSY